MKVVEWTFQQFLDNRNLWNSTLQQSLDNSIFLTWEWLSNWWEHFGSQRRFLVLTVVDDKQILAAAPLMISKSPVLGLKVEFIGAPDSDYHGFLLTPNSAAAARLILDYLNQLKPDWDVIELREIPENSMTLEILRTVPPKSIRFREKKLALCPYLPLPDDFDNYLRRLNPHFVKELRRRERRLKESYRVSFQAVDGSEAVGDAMEFLFSLHQKRWKSKMRPGIFSDRKVRDFHLDVARSFIRKGWLVLAFLMLNDDPVASLYNYRYSNKMYCYLSGFEPAYSKYGVGSILDLRLIEYSIRNGLREYDFMRGDEPYKTMWGTHAKRNLRISAARKKTVRFAYDCIDFAKDKVRALTPT